jgi:hypothetical protein
MGQARHGCSMGAKLAGCNLNNSWDHGQDDAELVEILLESLCEGYWGG